MDATKGGRKGNFRIFCCTSLLQAMRATLHNCHFANKNITDKPDKVERILLEYFFQNKLEGRRPLVFPISTEVNFY